MKNKVDTLAVIIKTNKKEYRQVMLTDEEMNSVINFLQFVHLGKIKVSPKKIESIEF
jgi:hypothetical protein